MALHHSSTTNPNANEPLSIKQFIVLVLKNATFHWSNEPHNCSLLQFLVPPSPQLPSPSPFNGLFFQSPSLSFSSFSPKKKFKVNLYHLACEETSNLGKMMQDPKWSNICFIALSMKKMHLVFSHHLQPAHFLLLFSYFQRPPTFYFSSMP